MWPLEERQHVGLADGRSEVAKTNGKKKKERKSLTAAPDGQWAEVGSTTDLIKGDGYGWPLQMGFHSETETKVGFTEIRKNSFFRFLRPIKQV